ncbi:MFS transporter [Xinfangfangia sp. CPCC 101601]|uniref:MFS transporter n=1 Tax=Pseudogemmobacter lacusdianii TaxID=3069608 RepID=A0ABU0VX04_9RHOB|nr:MFS transporter [Xinfangfangia sp. CPCC 101601]MDQ2066272.1 MFS transporter [Xinfangfangia sp. CPCC 101601]
MSWTGPLAALKLPAFRWYSLGNFSSLTGTWAQRTVLFWLAWELTGSTTILGLMALLDLMPAVIMAPIGGSLADRFDRLRVAQRVQYIGVVPPVALLLLSGLDMLTLPMLLLGAVATGMLNGLDHPIRLVLVGSITPREMIPQAVGLNSLTFNLSRTLGPMIGGWCIASDAYALVFALNICSFLTFAAVLRQIEPASREGQSSNAQQKPVGWRGLLPGMGRLEKLSLAYYGVIAFCLRPVMDLLPAFASTLARPGPEAVAAFTLLSSAVGLGAMVGAFIASARRGRGMTITSGLGAAASVLLFVLSAQVWLAALAVAMASAGIMANAISTQVAIQIGVAEELRGKAMALYALVLRVLPALGAVLTGHLLAQPNGFQWLFWLCAAVAISGATLWRLLRRLPDEA